MLSWLRSALKRRSPAGAPPSPGARTRTTEVGWLVDWPHATFIFDAPRTVGDKPPPAASPKSANRCPALLDHEARLYEIRCPFDLSLKIGRGRDGRPAVVNTAGRGSSVAAPRLADVVHLMEQERWRDPRRPVVQISAPWRFVADEPTWLNQLPAVHHYRDPPLPGLLIGGRFPIHLWPRTLMWAFEWHDPKRELVLQRGEPWFCVRFETGDPARHVRLVEAEMTPELRAYCQGLDGVTSYVQQTYRLFATAASRRPVVLLRKKPGA